MEKLQERAAQIEEQIAQLDESEDTDSDTDLTKLALPMILEIEDAVPADVQAPAEPTPASDGADGTPVVPAIAPAPPVTPVPPVGTAPGAR
jgi:hypothetical protein